MPGNPAEQAEPPKIAHKALRILSQEQMEIFLAAADRDPV